MSSAGIARVAYGQYLAAEATSERKHEWLDGAVVAMAGGTPEHSLLKTNLARAVGNALADAAFAVDDVYEGWQELRERHIRGE